MRILQVSSARNRGGGETHVIELAAALRKRGHAVVMAGRRDGPLDPEIKLPFLNSADLFTALRLRSVLRKSRFDILHAHAARDYTVVAAAAWGIPAPKLVLTRHLLYPVRPHRLYRRVDGWIAPTSQILKTLDPFSPKTSAVIPNWVDVEKFRYRPNPLHDPVTIGLLGQVSPHKGHDDAVEAMRGLPGGYRMLIAGNGDREYVDALKRKAAGIPVEFVGFVSPPEFFARIDILAAPSWEEPFGIVLLEAMASGIPVISTDRGGPLDIIPSAAHGVLVPPRDPLALADAIEALAGDNDRRSAIVRNAREHVEKTFDIRSVVPRIEDFYRRVMNLG
ncbi:MAG: glycosyltransferase family 4 protein [Acidobacteria bacterium]|nr:glycosyltransferase family 4 protein [Acidobacteriota bacterium]